MSLVIPLLAGFYSGWSGTIPDTGAVSYGVYVSNVTTKIVLEPALSWTYSRSIGMSGWKVKGVRLWFSAGCRNKVQIRMHYNKSLWLPDPLLRDMDGVDWYEGNDNIVWIPVNKVISNNDVIDIYFRNLDNVSHLVDVKFDVIGDREWKEETESDILAKTGKGNVRVETGDVEWASSEGGSG